MVAPLHSTVLNCPFGAVKITVDNSGALVRISFLHDQTAPLPAASHEQPHTAHVTSQLREYFTGARRGFDLPLAPVGTTFQLAVWDALQEIPFADTRSYGELARAIDRPGASRAVGGANNANPIAIVIPCHRVIGADGRLTGFGGGVATKRWLLDHEQQVGATANTQVAQRAAGRLPFEASHS